MGWLNIFACCVRSREHDRHDVASSETETLVAPSRLRERSLVTQQEGYGTMSMDAGFSPPRAGLTEEQRARMTEISRVAGSHMRPIDEARRSSLSFTSRATSSSGPPPGLALSALNPADLGLGAPPGPDTNTSASPSPLSSRTSSPSPSRPDSSPPGGVMRASRSSSSASGNSVDANGVVRKSIFNGAMTSASSKPRGKGRRPRALSRATPPPA
ncbi:uncharacterized protein LOC62_07G009252 [Vanrija pseudolonga]|uniref:Uncharacterized protein n=1 Tax=Vanrija pseudolonga TaxID=143232 RepID=A0AAF1BLE6_9TREE|nr:hypothetical protein LOC62_07G009252 [Vanrija pseudolonga]